MSTNPYPAIMSLTRSLPGIVNQAHRNDLTEMYLTMAASAGIFPLPGMAAAMRAGAALGGARARCDSAVARITSVTHGWLSASSQSLQLLEDNVEHWKKLTEESRTIGKDMQDLLKRSRANGWTGVAHDRKDEVHEAQVEAQEQFSTFVSVVPAALANARTLTAQIFMQIQAPLAATTLVSRGISARMPLPRPAGFGMCTRTPELAGHLTALADRLETQRSGGMWRPLESTLSTMMRMVGTSMRTQRTNRSKP